MSSFDALAIFDGVLSPNFMPPGVVAFLFEFVVEMQHGAIRLNLGVHKHWLHDMKMLCNGVKLQGNAIAKWSNELEA